MYDYSKLPEHMRGGAKLYIEDGVPPGGFMMAVITNDLIMARMKADSINRDCLFSTVDFWYNEAPAGCWKNKENVERWLESGGLRGQGQLKGDPK